MESTNELLHHLWLDSLAVLFFGIVAVLLMGFGYKFIDWLLKRVDLEQEVSKDNKSSAIVSASIFVSIAIVVSTVLNGVLR